MSTLSREPPGVNRAMNLCDGPKFRLARGVFTPSAASEQTFEGLAREVG